MKSLFLRGDFRRQKNKIKRNRFADFGGQKKIKCNRSQSLVCLIVVKTNIYFR